MRSCWDICVEISDAIRDAYGLRMSATDVVDILADACPRTTWPLHVEVAVLADAIGAGIEVKQP